MRNILKLGFLFGFAFCGVFVAAIRETQAKSAAVTYYEGLVSPRSLFIQNCARCHGSNGKAQTPLGRKLEATDLTSADVQDMSIVRITRAIRNCRPDMRPPSARNSPPHRSILWKVM